MFEQGHRLLAFDGGEVVEELAERMAGFEIVEKRLNRDPRAGEDGGPAHDLGLRFDDRAGCQGGRHGRRIPIESGMARRNQPGAVFGCGRTRRTISPTWWTPVEAELPCAADGRAR